MPNSITETDQGEFFGRWNDPTSQYLYTDSTLIIKDNHLPKIPDNWLILDYGGGNGLLKECGFSNSLSIDSDPEKKPDICIDIFDFKGRGDLAVIRYLLHYLTDKQVLLLMDQAMATCARIFIQQFVNEDLGVKYANSANETKYFRSKLHLMALLPDHAKIVYEHEYEVTPEFYKNRLGFDNGVPHSEIMLGITINFF